MAFPGVISSDADRFAIERALLELTAVRAWFEPAARAQLGSLEFRVNYARASRKLGADAKRPLSALVARVPNLKPHWTLLDGARWQLIWRALDGLDDDRAATCVHDLLLGGELGEQVSLLRMLCALPAPERFLQTAVEACRTNSVAVFEAIACENPYPTACFPDLAFNQMVIKTIFLELSVERIERLDARITPELVRMAEGLGSERRAAGRVVPTDIDFILTRARQP